MSKVIGKTKVRGSRVIGAKEKFQGLVTIQLILTQLLIINI